METWLFVDMQNARGAKVTWLGPHRIPQRVKLLEAKQAFETRIPVQSQLCISHSAPYLCFWRTEVKRTQVPCYPYETWTKLCLAMAAIWEENQAVNKEPTASLWLLRETQSWDSSMNTRQQIKTNRVLIKFQVDKTLIYLLVIVQFFISFPEAYITHRMWAPLICCYFLTIKKSSEIQQQNTTS